MCQTTFENNLKRADLSYALVNKNHFALKLILGYGVLFIFCNVSFVLAITESAHHL